jgi:lipopolysaccharide export system permease protein
MATAQRYEIEFWKKFLSAQLFCDGDAGVAFAYLHFRSSGIASYVFAG